MGLISDFVLVDPAEIATRFPGWERPSPDWMPDGMGTDADLDGLEVLQLKGISTVMLDVLVEAVGVDARVDTPFVSGSAEQMLTVLPTRTVQAMAALEGPAMERWIDAVVAAWRADLGTIGDSRSRELSLAGCTRDSWAPVLEELVQLASRCEPPYVLGMFSSV